ncbi:MAG: aspartate kinase [Limnochordia bacterium]|jgi:aspartate kinase|nr:aspartate kinase [Limnochordia bacterium]MDD2629870.1 aspartate kinase [Limnochordia bacterium]
MAIIVQKFGGTSLASEAMREKAIEHIQNAKEAGDQVVVVVSAMGRKGSAYATDTLIDLMSQVSDRPNKRALDLVMSCGEIISCSLLVQLLARKGIEAIPLTGAQAGIITDAEFGNARIIEVRPKRILEELGKNRVVVVAGFQGCTTNQEITTLGRGGSDTTAAALGVALQAKAVYIFTDVDGILTADPRIVPDAQRLPNTTYREVTELAQLGAKVIHPRAVEIAMQGRVPLIICATGKDGSGTVVGDGPWDGPVEIKGDRLVSAVTQITGLALVSVLPDAGHGISMEQARQLFTSVAGLGVSVDLIFLSPGLIGFCVGQEEAGLVENRLRELVFNVSVKKGYAKVSCVGAGMRGVPGVMAKIVEALYEADVCVYHTSDSHASISCLVEEKDYKTAVRALHCKFDLGSTNVRGS